MSKNHGTHVKPYIVRGFDVTQVSSFTPNGAMDAQPTFVEKVITKQYDAVTALLVGSIGTMAPNRARTYATSYPQAYILNDLTNGTPEHELTVVDLKVVTNATASAELRSYRTELREIFKRWAEKSRVPGVRGWRASALKEPTFEFVAAHHDVVIRTQAILGSAVFYNERRATVGVPVDFQQAVTDLEGLKKHVQACLGPLYRSFYYVHSAFGKGEVL